MMSLETIHALEREQAKKAAAQKKRPYVFHDLGDLEQRPLPIPNLGSYRPAGWVLEEELFVDHSGVGAPGEPALTQDQFFAKVRQDILSKNTYGYAIISVGPFQLYVGRFKKKKKQ